MLFLGPEYYPFGGMEDFFASYDSLEEAKNNADFYCFDVKGEDQTTEDYWEFHWAHIYDITEQKIVWTK